MDAISISSFQKTTGLVVQDQGSTPGVLDPGDKIFVQDPALGLVPLSYADAVERYRAACTPGAAKNQAIEILVNDFVQSAHDHGFGGYGDVDYWSKRTKSLAFETTAFLAKVGLESDGQAGAAVLPTVHEALGAARSASFGGYGDVSYWSRRCKSLSTTATDSARTLELELARAAGKTCSDLQAGRGAGRRTATLAHPSTIGAPVAPQRHSEAVSRLVAEFLPKAHSYAHGGYGDVDYWSKRTKELAFEAGAAAAELAFLTGTQSDIAIRDEVHEL
ncbi:MAG: hypothetical protein AAFY60_10530, partial [Myxococcota bacterium]